MQSKNKLSFKLQQFLFSSLLLFLVQICFVNSLISTFEFIWTFERNEYFLLFSKIVFIFLLIYQIYSPTITNYLVSFFFSMTVLNYCKNLKNFMDRSQEKYPFLTFFVVYSYVCIFGLYWFTFIVTETDIFVTLIYCFLNIVKLIFFPLVISTYIYANRQYVMSPVVNEMLEGLRNAEEFLSYSKKFLSNVKILVKKNPKTAIILTGATLATAGMSAQGKSAQEYVSGAVGNPHIPIMTVDKLAQLSNLECSEIAKNLYTQGVSLMLESEKRSLTIGYHDFLKIIQGQPTMVEQFQVMVTETASLLADNSLSMAQLSQLSESARQEITKQAQQAILEELNKQKALALSGSPVSRSLDDSSINEPEITGTALVTKSDVTPPSCLEEILFNIY